VPLILSESDVRQLLSMDELIDAMEEALRRFSAGEVQQPLRTVLEVGAERAYFGVMPAAMGDPPALGAKLVTVFAANHAKGLPSHLATILLFDPLTGALACLLDGRYITEARTAAVSAVSARALARPDADVLAILGSGVQARSHLEAIARVRPLRAVRVWSPTEAHRRRFADEMGAVSGLTVEAAPDARTAVREAQIIVLVTASPVPVLQNDWVAPGAHVVAVGACRPDQREMDPALVARGRLFVDSRQGALSEAGDVVLGIAEGRFGPGHLAGELGELLDGRVRGRVSIQDLTIFKSLGMAVEDVAAARLAYRRAGETGKGREMSM
jgi:alanine dehydrogenase